MSQRGFIYAASLGVIILITIASASLLIRGVSETSLSERSRNQSGALQLAEAGVDRAVFNLRTDNATLVSETLPTGSFSLLSIAAEGADGRRVQVRGTDASEQRSVEVIIRQIPASVFEFALFGAQNLNVSGSAITDSYNSENGVYDSNNHDHNGDVGTNATTAGGVTVNGSIFIDGQVAVGPDVSDPTSVVTGYDPAFITGGTSPASDTQDVLSTSSTFPMTSVDLPPGIDPATQCPDTTIQGGTELELTPTGGPLSNGTYCYRNLTVQGNAKLTASGNVTVYLTGTLTARGDSVIGNPLNPMAMAMLMVSNAQATLEEGTFTGSTQFYGGLYGPDATITVQGNAEVFGSVVGKVVNVTGSAAIHYDEAMTQRNDISNLFKTSVVSWRELSPSS